MERRALLRASDADREGAADRLRTAAAEGRLSDEELEDRLRAAYSARTYGELDPLLADLPTPARLPGRRPSRPALWSRPVLALAALAALFSVLLDGHRSAVAAHGGRHGAGPLAGHPFGGSVPLHHLLALVSDVAGVLLFVLVLTGLAVWALVRRLGRAI
jgi:hypothetical protein